MAKLASWRFVSQEQKEDEFHGAPKLTSSSYMLLSSSWPQRPSAQFAQAVYSPWSKQGRGSKGCRALKFSVGPANSQTKG